MSGETGVSAAQLAAELGCGAWFVYDHARGLGGEKDNAGRWGFDLAEARRRYAQLRAE